MQLIIPVCGKSSRYPDVRPKYLLTHPSGNLMIYESIKLLNLEKFDIINIVILKEHEDKYKVKNALYQQFKNYNLHKKLNIIEIDQSFSQAETIYKALIISKIKKNFLIKDCDNQFTFSCNDFDNYVCSFNLEKTKNINAINKSYIQYDEKYNIKNIAEKSIISNIFCTGGFFFKNADDFIEHYHKIKKINNKNEIYVSHVIYDMIISGKHFKNIDVSDYKDWGTLNDWKNYCSKFTTYFIDIDGVVVENSSQFFNPQWGETKSLEENVKILNELYNTKNVQIILTTSRTKKYKKITKRQLKKIGLQYDKIVFNLFHCKRIIINDFSNTNNYKSCDAINIIRNSNNLKDYLN